MVYKISPSNYRKKYLANEIVSFFESEDVLHINCVKWFRFQYGDTGAILHHSPNENPYGDKIKMIQYNKKMEAMGRLKGEPDIRISFCAKTLLIEFKSKKGIVTQHQKDVINAYRKQGFEAHICRTLEEFQIYVNDFMQKCK